MPRRPRPLVAGGYYHVTARGDGKYPIYFAEADRVLHLRLVAKTVERFRWSCLTYCQMGNHYHLLIQTPEPNLSSGMQYLQSTYAQRLAERHGLTGHVFGSRYGAQLIGKDAHLLEVIRYVALNPVRAGLCAHPADWPWSAHRFLNGSQATPAFVDRDAVWSLLSARSGRAGQVYESFVGPAPGAGGPDDESELARLLEARDPELGDLLPSEPSDAELIAARRVHGFTVTALARHFGLDRAAVSRRISRAERLAHDTGSDPL